MREAQAAYVCGLANDFQRQFVEHVDPLVIDLLSKLKTRRQTIYSGRTNSR
jgi:hypothetical protein